MRFVVHEVHEFEKHYQSLGAETPCDRDTIDMVIDATQQLAACHTGLEPRTRRPQTALLLTRLSPALDRRTSSRR